MAADEIRQEIGYQRKIKRISGGRVIGSRIQDHYKKSSNKSILLVGYSAFLARTL